jgi:hypothetical protein
MKMNQCKQVKTLGVCYRDENGICTCANTVLCRYLFGVECDPERYIAEGPDTNGRWQAYNDKWSYESDHADY